MLGPAYLGSNQPVFGADSRSKVNFNLPLPSAYRLLSTRTFTISIVSRLPGEATYGAVDATTKFLYVTNATDNTISGLSIGAGGVLGAAVTGSPFAAGSVPVGIAIDPSNSMLAVANLSDALLFHCDNRST